MFPQPIHVQQCTAARLLHPTGIRAFYGCGAITKSNYRISICTVSTEGEPSHPHRTARGTNYQPNGQPKIVAVSCSRKRMSRPSLTGHRTLTKKAATQRHRAVNYTNSICATIPLWLLLKIQTINTYYYWLGYFRNAFSVLWFYSQHARVIKFRSDFVSCR